MTYFHFFLRFIQNFKVDFYLAPINSTCLPSVGLFTISHAERLNYSHAIDDCTQRKSILADILSSARTNLLSTMILEQSNKILESEVLYNNASTNGTVNHVSIRHAFVGLQENSTSKKYISSKNQTIDCILYRAWHPKHPR